MIINPARITHKANFVMKGITKTFADEIRKVEAKIKAISKLTFIILKKIKINRPGKTRSILLFRKNNAALSAAKKESTLYQR